MLPEMSRGMPQALSHSAPYLSLPCPRNKLSAGRQVNCSSGHETIHQSLQVVSRKTGCYKTHLLPGSGRRPGPCLARRRSRAAAAPPRWQCPRSGACAPPTPAQASHSHYASPVTSHAAADIIPEAGAVCCVKDFCWRAFACEHNLVAERGGPQGSTQASLCAHKSSTPWIVIL